MKKLLFLTAASLALPAQGDDVTYARDIAPILQKSCVGCHRDGGGAPFVLTDYASTSRKAGTILRVVEDRFMPPWHAIGGDVALVGDRRLREEEIALFKTWQDAGRPEGDPKDLPPPHQYPEGWTLGEPDLILTMDQAYELPAEGPDIYRNFVLPTSLPAGKYLKAIEFRPSSPEVVHHALFSVDTKGRAREVDAADTEPGFAEMPVGEGTGRSIGGWVPGASPFPLPEGLAHHLPAHSDVVIQAHFHLTGKPEREQSQIGFYFGDKPPPAPVHQHPTTPGFRCLLRHRPRPRCRGDGHHRFFRAPRRCARLWCPSTLPLSRKIAFHDCPPAQWPVHRAAEHP